MNLPTLDDIKIDKGRALVRADLDIDPKTNQTRRLEVLLPTLEFLINKNFSVVLLGHRGRPGGEFDQNLSLEEVGRKLEELLISRWGEEKVSKIELHLMENLRFNEGERTNDMDFAKTLAKEGEIYINDAFAASHRSHASIVTLPEILPHFAGRRFVEEVSNLKKAKEDAAPPIIVVIGGAKEDKLTLLPYFKQFADKILVGGRLPLYMEEGYEDAKVSLAHLNADKSDITVGSMEKFEEEVGKAKTIILAGPMGKFEEEGYMLGTKRVFGAVASSDAYKLAGGGDTQKALATLGLEDLMDWVSVGGGASLEFLAHGTLPGIEALIN